MTHGFEGTLCGKHSPGSGKFVLNTPGYVCVWVCVRLGVSEVTTGSSAQPRSTAHSSRGGGGTLPVEPLIPGRFREDCEDASHRH